MKPSRPASTFDRIMKDPKRRRKFDSNYRSFLLSEVIHGLMDEEGKSVRELAREVGISPTVIQDIRSGGRSNVTIVNPATGKDITSYETSTARIEERIANGELWKLNE